MAIARVQVVLPGRSNVAEDQFVNTFHVDMGISTVATNAETLSLAFSNMFNATAPGALEPLAVYMSGFINRSLCTTRIYDLSTPKPRVPTITPWTLAPQQVMQNDLPEEVALCMSFKGSPPNTARRRGRVYIGPLNIRASIDDTGPPGALPSRPTVSFMQVLALAGKQLKADIDSQGYTWVIQSERPSLNYVPVEAGWCDNSWDTQRRRGVDPTARSVWPSPA